MKAITSITVFSTSKSLRDDIKTKFPSIGILNDLHQSFEVVFPKLETVNWILKWLIDQGITFSVKRG